jgi:hypothetical protein
MFMCSTQGLLYPKLMNSLSFPAAMHSLTVWCGLGLRQSNAPVVLSTIPYLALRIRQERLLVRLRVGSVTI